MNWHNTQKDPLPHDGQKVLIAVNGIYYGAVFDQKAGVFKVINNDSMVFDAHGAPVYWSLLT